MITIVDYGAGNLTSVKRALDFLEISSTFASTPDKILKADRIIFPGVGHAETAMKTLNERNLATALKSAFLNKVPILGICLGTQIILSHSQEGPTDCLDLIEGETVKFNLSNRALKIPHMGWNTITIDKPHPVLAKVGEKDEFYFVHSYYPVPSNSSAVIARCEYEISFPVVIGYQNLVATQFHPEKSGPVGLSILDNFSQWDGVPYAE